MKIEVTLTNFGRDDDEDWEREKEGFRSAKFEGAGRVM